MTLRVTPCPPSRDIVQLTSASTPAATKQFTRKQIKDYGKMKKKRKKIGSTRCTISRDGIALMGVTICAFVVFCGAAMATAILTSREEDARYLSRVLWDVDTNRTEADDFKRAYRSTQVRVAAYRGFRRASKNERKDELMTLRRALRKTERKSRTAINAILLASLAFCCASLCALVYLAFAARMKQGMAAKSRRALLKGMGVPAMVVDRDFRTVVDANRAALDKFEYDKSELIGRCIDDVLPGFFDDDVLPDDASNSSVSTHCPSRRRRTIGVTATGNKLVLVCDSTRLVFENGTTYDTVIAQDITELVLKTDDLEVQKKVLSQFTHEMRNKYTPATHMLEHVQNLVETEFTDLHGELRESLHDIRLSVGLLHEADQLVATRLQLHKIYSGSYVSSPNIETVEILDSMEHRVQAAAAMGHRNVAFLAEIWPTGYEECELHVRVDMYMWTHLANNLLSNARKHTTSGHVVLALVGEHEGKLTFSVRDTGRGVPESIAKRLFHEEVASGDVRGVGLGLVSCKKFAESIGGNCWLHSTKQITPDSPEDSGSDFRFSLPGKIVSSHKKRESRPDLRELDFARYVPPDLTVVVVEDSALIRKSIVTKLETACRLMMPASKKSSWTFVQHATVESFLPHVKEYDRFNCLVTLDHNLDSQGGHSTGSDLLRAINPGFQGRLISVSGDENTADEHKFLGAHASWGKPLPSVSTICHTLVDIFRTD